MAIEKNRAGKWRISKTQEFIYDSKQEAQKAVIARLMERINAIKRSINKNINDLNQRDGNNK